MILISRAICRQKVSLKMLDILIILRMWITWKKDTKRYASFFIEHQLKGPKKQHEVENKWFLSENKNKIITNYESLFDVSIKGGSISNEDKGSCFLEPSTPGQSVILSLLYGACDMSPCVEPPSVSPAIHVFDKLMN